MLPGRDARRRRPRESRPAQRAGSPGCAARCGSSEPQTLSAVARNVVAHYRAEAAGLPEETRAGIHLRWLDDARLRPGDRIQSFSPYGEVVEVSLDR